MKNWPASLWRVQDPDYVYGGWTSTPIFERPADGVGRILLALFLFSGFGGIVGGVGVMKEALPFPSVWPEGTPFHAYFFPGLILCVIVGGSQLAAAFLLLRRRSAARMISLLAGLILTGWMIGELALIGFRAPIQMWFVALGLGEVALSFAKLRRA